MKKEINLSEYPKDVKRIQRILFDKGYQATLMECEALWQRYSDSMCAGWLGLPKKDDDILDALSSFLE